MNILKNIKKTIGKRIYKLLRHYDNTIFGTKSYTGNCELEEDTLLYEPYELYDCKIGKGTYIAKNALVTMTDIGKYCSIGPNFLCGWGIHPTDGISTSPAFYSTLKQNGMTFSREDKIQERKRIYIGNDVFIGMNVTILDGLTIGDGVIIAAGAVVTKDIEPYSIVGGVPAKHIKYRFTKEQIEKMLKIEWWNWDNDKLKNVEKMFFDIAGFIDKYSQG